MDNELIVGFVRHSVLEVTLKCFKETSLEILVQDITEWTSLSVGYAEHDYHQECISLDCKNLFIC